MQPVEILADDLLLRPWRPADVEHIFRACQDPAIQRWTSLPSPYTRADAESFVARAAAGWSPERGAPSGVFDRSSGALLGACAVGGQGNLAQLGYWTAPWARGRQVALRSSRALAGYAFTRLGLPRLVWQAEIGNHASRLVALRAGVRISGSWRYANPHRLGRREAWVGTLLPGEVTIETPRRYARGSVVARRAAVYGTGQPELPLAGDVPGRLRPCTAGDLTRVTGAAQDPESARWTTVPVPYTIADAEFFVFDHAPTVWARGQGAVFAIADADDGYVGSIDLRVLPDDEDTAEVGFLVAPWARGRAYAPAALRALCAWAFDALRLTRVEWRAYLGNEASKRVAEKAGFTIEGILRASCVQRGERRDAWVGARLAADPG